MDEKKIIGRPNYLMRLAGYALDNPNGCMWKPKHVIEKQAPQLIKQFEVWRSQQEEMKSVQEEAA